MNPLWQAVHVPDPAAQDRQFRAQARHSPSPLSKNPFAQLEHAVEFPGLVAQPLLQVQDPEEEQTPLRQLQEEGRLDAVVERHFPVPAGPSSHVRQLGGQAGWMNIVSKVLLWKVENKKQLTLAGRSKKSFSAGLA
jgi:hypothetical protein